MIVIAKVVFAILFFKETSRGFPITMYVIFFQKFLKLFIVYNIVLFCKIKKLNDNNKRPNFYFYFSTQFIRFNNSN